MFRGILTPISFYTTVYTAYALGPPLPRDSPWKKAPPKKESWDPLVIGYVAVQTSPTQAQYFSGSLT